MTQPIGSDWIDEQIARLEFQREEAQHRIDALVVTKQLWEEDRSSQATSTSEVKPEAPVRRRQGRKKVEEVRVPQPAPPSGRPPSGPPPPPPTSPPKGDEGKKQKKIKARFPGMGGRIISSVFGSSNARPPDTLEEALALSYPNWQEHAFSRFTKGKVHATYKLGQPEATVLVLAELDACVVQLRAFEAGHIDGGKASTLSRLTRVANELKRHRRKVNDIAAQIDLWRALANSFQEKAAT